MIVTKVEPRPAQPPGTCSHCGGPLVAPAVEMTLGPAGQVPRHRYLVCTGCELRLVERARRWSGRRPMAEAIETKAT